MVRFDEGVRGLGEGAQPILAESPHLYSPKYVEAEFCEVRGSKQPIRHSGYPMTEDPGAPFGVKTLRLGSSSCTDVYQGVATRNGATTREIVAYRTESQPNFAMMEF